MWFLRLALLGTEGSREQIQGSSPLSSILLYSSSKASCVQSSFHLFKCIIFDVSQGDQTKHLEWKVLRCFTILNPAIRKNVLLTVIVFRLGILSLHLHELGKLTLVHLMYISPHLISICIMNIRALQETCVPLCLTWCSLSNWPGVSGQVGTL